ncbi:MAG: SDR family oxidoreductase, partial [Limisphaerales bacterium]
AIVQVLAAAGMDVVFTYRENAVAAAEVAAAGEGMKITGEAVDVRDSAACAALAEKVFDRTGRIDLLVNNAGVIRDNPLGALEPEDVHAVLATNVEGVFNMTRAVVSFMISQRRGKIINLSSVAGEKGGRGQTNYAASKGAINAFTRALAVEVAPRGITVNAVAPGVIDTEMSRAVRDRAGDQVQSRILLRRVGRPEEVAHAVWFLGSRYADYITGQILHVDGGFKME